MNTFWSVAPRNLRVRSWELHHENRRETLFHATWIRRLTSWIGRICLSSYCPSGYWLKMIVTAYVVVFSLCAGLRNVLLLWWGHAASRFDQCLWIQAQLRLSAIVQFERSLLWSKNRTLAMSKPDCLSQDLCFLAKEDPCTTYEFGS